MDYVIKNGTVCLEGEHFRADVTVREGKIQALGQAVHSGHEQVIDADGAYLCPGFIDGHIHIESTLLSPPVFALVVSGGLIYSIGTLFYLMERLPFHKWTYWVNRDIVEC